MTRPTPDRLRVLLVDDEPPALLGLRALLAPHGDAVVVGEASGGRAAIEAVHALGPDLVFLDVQMPEVDGFAVVEAMLRDAPARDGSSARPPAVPPVVVFVTAHDAHALRAFEVGAADYLLKPVAADRFARALARARERLAAADAGARAEHLARVLQARDAVPVATPAAAPGPAYLRRLAVRVGTRDLVVPVDAIDWIEADDYCAVVHAGGRRHVVRVTLQALAAQLDPAEFVRVHRSALVRLSAVTAVHRRGLGRASLVLRDGRQLPISRSRRAEVLDRFGRTRLGA